MKKEEKQKNYEKHKDLRRKEVKQKDVKNLSNPVKEGNFWVIRANGRVLKNSKKKDVQDDYAVINNYKII